MTVVIVADDPTGKRLQRAFSEALPGGVLRAFPSALPPEVRNGGGGPWRLCLDLELGRQIRQQGWRDELIFFLTRQEFERRHVLVRPGDALLFHDLEQRRLKAAVRLALLGITLFPADILGKAPDPALACIRELSEGDRSVMAELADGASIKQIAGRLEQSPERVRQSVRRICRKLGGVNRTEAAMLAHCRFSPFFPSRQEDRREAR